MQPAWQRWACSAVWRLKYPAERAGNAAGAGAIPVPAGNMSYTPGTYSATAKGIASDVTVTMTFDETSITDVQIDVSGETPDIGGKIGDEMSQKILAATVLQCGRRVRCNRNGRCHQDGSSRLYLPGKRTDRCC